MNSTNTENNPKISVSSLINVPETMLIPLYFKAKETIENGLIKDEKTFPALVGVVTNKLDKLSLRFRQIVRMLFDYKNVRARRLVGDNTNKG